MKIYQTNAALGYNQLAFLIRLGKTPNGYDYLCIGTQCVRNSDEYYEGKIVKDLEDIYVEDSTFKLEDSSLHNEFLFNFYIQHHKQIKQPELQYNTILQKAYDHLDGEATDGQTTKGEKQMFIQGFLQACSWMQKQMQTPITVYKLEFDFFDASEWKTVTINITAASKIQLMKQFIKETRHIQTYGYSVKEAIKKCWCKYRQYIEVEELTFPIVSRKIN